jgi:nicotinamidase-related amidase
MPGAGKVVTGASHRRVTGGDLAVSRLTVERSELAVVVIDIQPYFLDGWMAGASDPLLGRIEHLLGLATVYDLPCLATFEQPVEKKGWLPVRLERAFPSWGEKVTKNTFDCCGEPDILAALKASGRPQLAVAGGETDVCLLQSVLGMISAGFEVFLLEDCLFSSEPHVGPAIRRMERAGAVPSTVKTLAYELRRSVANPPEKTLLASRDDAGFGIGDPEALSEWTPDW